MKFTQEKIANYLEKTFGVKSLDALAHAQVITNNCLFLKEIIEEAKIKLSADPALRNKVDFCPLCGGGIKDRKVTIYKELIQALYKIYCWCGKNKRHEFSMKDIREMLDRNNYARFGDLVRFGGLVYKVKDDAGNKQKAEYGLNMSRTKEFFNGKRQIPMQITLNQITNEIIDTKPAFCHEILPLSEMLDGKGMYDYEKDYNPDQKKLI